MHIKVSDGDLIIVVVPGGMGEKQMRTISDSFSDWVSKRGLQDIMINVYGNTSAIGMDIKVISVNNVFENEVLNNGRR